MKTQKTIFACNPAAMDKEQRARYSLSTERLFAGKGEVRELTDGLRRRLCGKSADDCGDGRVRHLRAFVLPVFKF